MARVGAPRRGRTPVGARVPWLVTAVVVALAYQQPAYVPAQVKSGLHTAVSVLAGLLLTQLTVRAAVAGVRAALDRLQDGELVLRLPRTAGATRPRPGSGARRRRYELSTAECECGHRARPGRMDHSVRRGPRACAAWRASPFGAAELRRVRCIRDG
jgi:hypothetical protein